MSSDYPTRKSVGLFRNEDVGFQQNMPPDSTRIPWIDSHSHAHTGSWNDRHEFDLSGGLAVVMVASSASRAPYRPMTAEDMQSQWDVAIKRCHAISRSHFFEPYVALAVHTTRTRTENWKTLVEKLPAYAELDEVIAIGETGISLNTAQVADPWPLETQKEVVAKQMAVARDANVPFICHTPKSMKSTGDRWVRGKTESGHNLPPSDQLSTEDSLDPESAKIDATKIDVQLANEANLPESRLVIDHANEETASYVLENTDCYVGFSMYGHPSHPPIETVADTIEEYGSDRVVINTDMSGSAEQRPCALKEVILDLLRLDVSPSDVRAAVYENPRDILGLTHLPE
ncbi:hypothetical protein SAMN04487967_2795 [Natronorubrum sediminis]|uniref:Uncharacterized protein n=1 Tax=Natronorubrum sediminis TaxID=640943 RepID=A0A1H6G499_9EURY|nr:TatD family hydrolase [Natronorubrum sediminis]SEH16824.1 hypothetical protein SAMN04487967_2795 [Natronorubrum sediminis]